MRIARFLFLLLAACGGTQPPPSPLPRIAMPDGKTLDPYDPANPGLARPYGMAMLGPKLYVALGNRSADNMTIAGPSFLAGVVPSQGVVDLLNLGGDGRRKCESAGVVRTDAGRVYVTCGGVYGKTEGQALVEVDPTGPSVTHILSLEHSPSGVAFAPGKIWVGTNDDAAIVAVDRASFSASSARVTLPCPKDGYAYVPDLAVIGGDLYALCATVATGTLFRLDASTGAVKGQFSIGAGPTALAGLADGRIAAVCSLDSTLWIATPNGDGSLSAANAYTYSKSATLQDVRALGKYVYTTASGTNTVQKVDVSTQPGKVVAEAATADNSFPWAVVPLDENTAIVSNSGTTNDLVTVSFVPAK